MPIESVKIVPYTSRSYDYRAFDSGNQEIDNWFHNNASQNEKLNQSRTHVLVGNDHESREVFGFFSLVNTQIDHLDASAVLGEEVQISNARNSPYEARRLEIHT